MLREKFHPVPHVASDRHPLDLCCPFRQCIHGILETLAKEIRIDSERIGFASRQLVKLNEPLF